MEASSPSLLCWNVAGRVRLLPEQAERILELSPDLICLQECTRTTIALWSERLSLAGWPYVATTPGGVPAPQRPLSALIAARRPLRAVEVAGVPWPERVVAVRLEGGLELVNVHSPISPKPDLVKVRTHEALFAHLAAGAGPRVLCGDLNTPRKEHPDGRVWTFARTQYGKLRPERGERWDRAELALIKGLEAHGIRDLFRELHGPVIRELSWEWPRWRGGYRLDHLIASREVSASEVGYLHGWRTDGLSDHSPLFARLTIRVSETRSALCESSAH